MKRETFAVVVIACTLAACSATPAAGIHSDRLPWWRDHSDLPVSSCKHIPYIAGDYYRTYIPSGTRYLNDHTLIRASSGVWHLYGITNSSAGDPEAEHEFLHATANSLFGPWTEQPDVLVADKNFGEQVLWAPHVIEREPGHFSMFYYGDLLQPENITLGLRQAESTNLWDWRRVVATSPPNARAPGGRDPFVIRDGSRWLLYSVGVDARSHGQILCNETHDPALRSWAPVGPVITDPSPTEPWGRGNLQSPFVLSYDSQYYLFVTRKSLSPIDYDRTNVFCSANPLHFDWQPVAELRAHAAEIVVQDGRYYTTSAGWTRAIGELHRGLSIAPLEWTSPLP